MEIFKQTRELVKIEKSYTAKILKNLMVIEKDKLYADLQYPSLHKYIVKELRYSDAEASIRVNAVRLMLKSEKAEEKIEKGEMNLTNASEANKLLTSSGQSKQSDNDFIDKVVDEATKSSTRNFRGFADKELGRQRRETLTLDEHTLEKFDRLRKEYGDLSTYELIQILLEEKLKAPSAPRRAQNLIPKNSRSIPKSVKAKVYTGKCCNCGTRHGLEYDHKLKYSHGGSNSTENIQLMCRSCNQRKEIQARQLGFFA